MRVVGREDNALSGGELTQDFRVGWGYNILQDFMSENSLVAPILDYNKLLKYEAELGEISFKRITGAMRK